MYAELVDPRWFGRLPLTWTPQEVRRAMVDLLPINAGRVVIHGDFSFDKVPLDESGLVTASSM
jgi:hypothetical protein